MLQIQNYLICGYSKYFHSLLLKFLSTLDVQHYSSFASDMEEGYLNYNV